MTRVFPLLCSTTIENQLLPETLIPRKNSSTSKAANPESISIKSTHLSNPPPPNPKKKKLPKMPSSAKPLPTLFHPKMLSNQERELQHCNRWRGKNSLNKVLEVMIELFMKIRWESFIIEKRENENKNSIKNEKMKLDHDKLIILKIWI